MKLSKWREEQRLTLAEAGALIGVTSVAFGRYERGRVPEPGALQKIIEVSNGRVTANDWFDVPIPAATPEETFTHTPPRSDAA